MAADVAPRGDARRVGTALAIATLVTLTAAVPLGIVAWSNRDIGPASTAGLVLSSSAGIESLSGLVIEPGRELELRIDDPQLVAVAWALYRDGEELVARDEALGPGPFVIDLSDGSFASLAEGRYDLLVTGTERDGSVVERAARFAVGDPR